MVYKSALLKKALAEKVVSDSRAKLSSSVGSPRAKPLEANNTLAIARAKDKRTSFAIGSRHEEK